MKITKSTAILSGILGVVSIGALITLAGPSIQQSLTSAITNTAKGNLMMGFNGGEPQIAQTNISEADAKAGCKSAWNKRSDDYKFKTITCTWQGKVIFQDAKKNLGTLAIVTRSELGKLTPQSTVTMSEADSLAKCQQDWNTQKVDPTFIHLSCTWNGATIFSETKETGTLMTSTNNASATESRKDITLEAAKGACNSVWKQGATNQKFQSFKCDWNGKTIFDQAKPPLGTLTTQLAGEKETVAQTNITEADAKAACKSAGEKHSGGYESYTCKWNNKIIYEIGNLSIVERTSTGALVGGPYDTTLRSLTDAQNICKTQFESHKKNITSLMCTWKEDYQIFVANRGTDKWTITTQSHNAETNAWEKQETTSGI